MKTAEIEKLIIDWLKSGNENTTYIANQISSLFKQPIAEGIAVPYQLCPMLWRWKFVTIQFSCTCKYNVCANL